MKTLIVSYLPREAASNTKKILDTFVKKIKGDIEYLDLIKIVPDFFSPESINAYFKRNYAGSQLNGEELASIKSMDQATQQLKAADALVLAFPMHNFSMPAAVKAYFDSVLQKGETWDMDKTGYVGLLKGRKALVISSSGGQYTEALGTKSWDFVTSQSLVLLGFMGFDAQVVMAQGMANPKRVAENLLQAQNEVTAIAEKW